LSWKNHVDKLMDRLSKAYYAIREVKQFIAQALRMTYFSYFHTIMSYGIIFWGNSFNSINIFRLQKKVIRIITNSRNKDYCRELLKKLRTLPFYSQYVFSLLTFVINNCNFLISNSVIYHISTRHNNNLDLPHVSLSVY
jgi:hypothetical protein